MDMDEDDTAPNLSAFITRPASEDESMEDYSNNSNNDEQDMDMTSPLSKDILRKRSLSSAGRQPLATVPSNNSLSDDQSFQQSDTSQNNSHSISFSSIDPDSSQPVEYTVPMGKALRRPSAPSQEWLALRSVTHSCDTPYKAPPSDDDGESDAMELTDALQRLTAVRRSLGLTDEDEEDLSTDVDREDVGANETFSSTEDSFRDMDAEDRTINITGLLSRASMGGASNSDLDMTGSWPIGVPPEDIPINLIPCQDFPATTFERHYL
jgi:hypothetical protein